MRLRSVISLVVVLVATFAACGSDSSSNSDLDPYIDALAADFAKADDESPPVSDEQARCAAEKSIEAIDEDVITAYDTPQALIDATKDNLSALDLDDGTLDTIAEEIVGCFGGVDFMLDALAEAGLTQAQVDCIRGSLTEADFVASVRADIAGETAPPEFEQKISACAEG